CQSTPTLPAEERDCVIARYQDFALAARTDRNLMHDPDDILEAARRGAHLLLTRILLVSLLVAATFPLLADDSDVKDRLGEELIARYQSALQSQKDAVKSVEMEVLM